jgi:hypothetical protein
MAILASLAPYLLFDYGSLLVVRKDPNTAFKYHVALIFITD